jgi:zinc/manganese transport system permease protein
MSGFFSSAVVHTALIAGTLVAVLAGTVGVFTVLRGQSFAAEALGDLGSAGGSSAFLLNISATWGFLGAAVGGAALMELIGVQRARGRDLATGVVLGLGFGLASLFFYLGTTHESVSGGPVTVLFGSLFAINNSQIPLILVLAVIAAGLVCLLYRPLLLSSVNPVLASTRGVRVKLVAAIYLITLAVAVALCDVTVGAILSTALIVGPAATALRLTARPGRAIGVAALIGVLATWAGIVLAYASYHWPPVDHGWPVSFFIVTFVLVAYLLAGLADSQWARSRRWLRRRRPAEAASAASRPQAGAR